MEPSRPCRSTTSTIMQVQLCLNDNIVLVLCVFVFALCVWDSVPNTQIRVVRKVAVVFVSSVVEGETESSLKTEQ